MKKPDTAIRLLTLAEAASILKISKRTLHRMIQHRQIPAFKVGGQWRILESRFQEWVEDEEQLTPILESEGQLNCFAPRSRKFHFHAAQATSA